ncbi:MAG: thioredoxin domain-containing protein [Pseudomonadales bacterium]|nr:thioredoxin domain-containing protein [Pseudomonadales bacterium]
MTEILENSNRLSQETSPYLLQHADNPVHWQIWSEASLKYARSHNKPILLSIGYTACHGCQAMAKDSFSDKECADVMNQHFVNIKVDREERPDLDKTYQLTHQLMTHQAGGWPLTVFLDPHTHLPFFSGTYFPRNPVNQLPGFVDLLLQVSSAFKTEAEAISKQTLELASLLERIVQQDNVKHDQDHAELLNMTTDAMEAEYDPNSGGFGQAPKFPMPSRINYLMRQFRYNYLRGDKNRGTLDKVMHTLTNIARGGIYDHLGGGFFRYATDTTWTVPHFEKKLYSNGELLELYSNALQFGPDGLFSDVIADTANWIIREMQTSGGGYCSGQDASTQAQNGKYYLWLRHKVKALLNEEENELVQTLFGLDKSANFQRHWILKRSDSWRSVVERLGMEPEHATQCLKNAKSKLLVERDSRPPPKTETKIITTCNARAIKGMLCASQQVGEMRWQASAFTALDFIQTSLWSEEEQRLYAVWAQGQAKHPAYLDDYANLMDATLTALTINWRDQDILFLTTLANTAIKLFFDEKNGGFYFTANDQEKLIYRPKPTHDDALPSGNAIIVQVLITLGHLLPNQHYLDIAEKTLNWAKPAIAQSPANHVSFVSALQNWLVPPELILIRGPLSSQTLWLDHCRSTYTPERVCFFIPYKDCNLIPDCLPKLISLEKQSHATAYIYREKNCSPPITSLAELDKKLAP